MKRGGEEEGRKRWRSHRGERAEEGGEEEAGREPLLPATAVQLFSYESMYQRLRGE